MARVQNLAVWTPGQSEIEHTTGHLWHQTISWQHSILPLNYLMTTQCSDTRLSHDNTAFCLLTISWLNSALHLHYLTKKYSAPGLNHDQTVFCLSSISWQHSVIPHEQTVVCLLTISWQHSVIPLNYLMNKQWSASWLSHDQHSILPTANVKAS